jgi:hypothetical protein
MTKTEKAMPGDGGWDQKDHSLKPNSKRSRETLSQKTNHMEGLVD